MRLITRSTSLYETPPNDRENFGFKIYEALSSLSTEVPASPLTVQTIVCKSQAIFYIINVNKDTNSPCEEQSLRCRWLETEERGKICCDTATSQTKDEP